MWDKYEVFVYGKRKKKYVSVYNVHGIFFTVDCVWYYLIEDKTSAYGKEKW